MIQEVAFSLEYCIAFSRSSVSDLIALSRDACNFYYKPGARTGRYGSATHAPGHRAPFSTVVEREKDTPPARKSICVASTYIQHGKPLNL